MISLAIFSKTSPSLLARTFDIVGDPSVRTYRGHSVAYTLIRCYFSPSFTTGQKYIITGSADGCIRSSYHWISFTYSYFHRSFLIVLVYDVLTGNVKLCLQESSTGNSQREQCIRDISWHPYENCIISTSVNFVRIRLCIDKKQQRMTFVLHHCMIFSTSLITRKKRER